LTRLFMHTHSIDKYMYWREWFILKCI